MKAYFIGGTQDLTVRALNGEHPMPYIRFAKHVPQSCYNVWETSSDTTIRCEYEEYQHVGELRYQRGTHIYEVVKR